MMIYPSKEEDIPSSYPICEKVDRPKEACEGLHGQSGGEYANQNRLILFFSYKTRNIVVGF